MSMLALAIVRAQLGWTSKSGNIRAAAHARRYCMHSSASNAEESIYLTSVTCELDREGKRGTARAWHTEPNATAPLHRPQVRGSAPTTPARLDVQTRPVHVPRVRLPCLRQRSMTSSRHVSAIATSTTSRTGITSGPGRRVGLFSLRLLSPASDPYRPTVSVGRPEMGDISAVRTETTRRIRSLQRSPQTNHRRTSRPSGTADRALHPLSRGERHSRILESKPTGTQPLLYTVHFTLPLLTSGSQRRSNNPVGSRSRAFDSTRGRRACVLRMACSLSDPWRCDVVCPHDTVPGAMSLRPRRLSWRPPLDPPN